MTSYIELEVEKVKKKWVLIMAIFLICIGGIYWILKPTEDEKILEENKKFTT